MRRKSAHLWISAVIVLLLSGLAVLLIFGFEREEYQRYRGYSGEARENPFLAGQLLLEGQGYRVRNLPNTYELESLSEEVATLFVFRGERSMDENVDEHILEWISRGGRCVCFLGSGDAEQNVPALEMGEGGLVEAVIEGVGIRVEKSGREAAQYEQKSGVDVDPRYCFTPETGADVLWRYPRDGDAHVMAVKYGRGSLVAAGGPFFAYSSRIEERENLRFFWALATGEGREVWFFRAEEFPPLLLVMVREGWMILLSVALCAAVMIWTFAPRFGPILYSGDHREVDFAEHVSAVGRFFIKQERGDVLLRDMREDALRNIHAVLPAFEKRSREEQEKLLTRFFNLSGEEARFFLENSGKLPEEEFRSYIGIAERIRKWK